MRLMLSDGLSGPSALLPVEIISCVCISGAGVCCHMAEAMHEVVASHEADSPDSVDYAALCDILLPGQGYSEHVAPQLLTALKQAVLMLDKLVVETASADGISASHALEGRPPPFVAPAGRRPCTPS